MKKIIFAAALLLLSQGYVQAQDIKGLPPQERATKQTEWMKSNLNLSAEQVPRVEEINLRYANKMEDIRKSSQGMPEKKDAARALSDQKDGELKGIFSESQYSAYRVKKSEIKEKMRK